MRGTGREGTRPREDGEDYKRKVCGGWSGWNCRDPPRTKTLGVRGWWCLVWVELSRPSWDKNSRGDGVVVCGLRGTVETLLG